MAEARPRGFGALLTIVVGVWFFTQVTFGELVETIQSFLGKDDPPHAGPQGSAVKGSTLTIGKSEKRKKFVDILRRQVKNEREYEWGGTTKKTGFDCSGIIQFAMGKLGHADFPRVSSDQIAHARPMSIARARWTAGAVLHFPGHIAVSVGDGIHTYEARGEAYGVVKATIRGRGFTSAGMFPELA